MVFQNRVTVCPLTPLCNLLCLAHDHDHFLVGGACPALHNLLWLIVFRLHGLITSVVTL